MGQEILLKAKPAVEEHLRRTGHVLVDMRLYRNQMGHTVLEALVDRAEGGITLDECTLLNREIGGLLDAAGMLGLPYTLDVSSPGLDRPLATPADYRRALGRTVRVFLKEPVEGRIEYVGVVVAVTQDQITVATKQKTLNLFLDKVNKAKQVIE